MGHLRIWKYISVPWVTSSLLFFLAFLFLAFFQEISNTFLTSELVLQLLKNTLLLTILVGLITFLIAAPFAILTSLYKFPGHNFFSWSLSLPLVFPAYIYAFIFVGGLEYSGPIASWFRDFGIILPSIRNILGASLVMSLALYPYIFLLMKAQIKHTGIPIFKAAKTLGKSDVAAIRTILLPTLKPSIFAGVILAMLETLADFGGVSTLRIETFTVAIYNAWFGYQDYYSGARLAGILFIFVLILVFLSKNFIDSKKTGSVSSDVFEKISLSKSTGFLSFFICSLLFLMAFLLPLIQLILWSDVYTIFTSSSSFTLFLNSGLLGLISAFVITCAALVLSLAYIGSYKMRPFITASTLGYAMPGSVIAVGLLIVINEIFDISLTSMGIFGLIIALTIRFITPAFQYLISASNNIPESSKNALATLPNKPLKALSQNKQMHIFLESLKLLKALSQNKQMHIFY